jgi:predicted RNase H-like HicB family nuclease
VDGERALDPGIGAQPQWLSRRYRIPAIPGVWANAKTLEACREKLESVLEGWVVVHIADHSTIPDIDGNRLEIRDVA